MPVREALRRAAACLSQPAAEYTEPLSCGVDLGTATCVLAVIDGRGVPIYVDQLPSRALRDGVVVDFHGAAATVARLKASGIKFTLRRQVGVGTWQIFCHDPCGAKVELDFSPEESAPADT